MSITEQISNLSEAEAKDILEKIIDTSYSIVQWPQSQKYMDEEWFQEETVLDNSENAEPSSYFIPTEYTF